MCVPVRSSRTPMKRMVGCSYSASKTSIAAEPISPNTWLTFSASSAATTAPPPVILDMRVLAGPLFQGHVGQPRDQPRQQREREHHDAGRDGEGNDLARDLFDRLARDADYREEIRAHGRR